MYTYAFSCCQTFHVFQLFFGFHFSVHNVKHVHCPLSFLDLWSLFIVSLSYCRTMLFYLCFVFAFAVILFWAKRTAPFFQYAKTEREMRSPVQLILNRKA